MTLPAFYERIDGDLDDVRRRLLTDERVEKFVAVFAADETYALLESAFAEGQGAVEQAFRAAHTLKGVGRDLGFTELSRSASELTEALRIDEAGAYGDMAEAAMLYERVKDAHATIMAALPLLDE